MQPAEMRSQVLDKWQESMFYWPFCKEAWVRCTVCSTLLEVWRWQNSGKQRQEGKEDGSVTIIVVVIIITIIIVTAMSLSSNLRLLFWLWSLSLSLFIIIIIIIIIVIVIVVIINPMTKIINIVLRWNVQYEYATVNGRSPVKLLKYEQIFTLCPTIGKSEVCISSFLFEEQA